jgi:pimeloyl-ACP methyl ester carboxylesterase
MTGAHQPLPALFGPNGVIFGLMFRPESHQADIAVVIHLDSDMTSNPAGMLLAREVAAAGYPTLVFDAPGHGESLVSLRGLEPALEQAAVFAGSLPADAVVLVAQGSAARAALAAAASSPKVRGVVLAAPALGDRARRLAETVGFGEYLRRALRPSSLRSLLDADRRKRYRELFEAKMAQMRKGRGRSSPDLSRPETFTGRSIHLYGSLDRRSTRSGSQHGPAEGPSPDMSSSFIGSIAGFESVPAQEWFVGAVIDWLRTLGPDDSGRPST